MTTKTSLRLLLDLGSLSRSFRCPGRSFSSSVSLRRRVSRNLCRNSPCYHLIVSQCGLYDVNLQCRKRLRVWNLGSAGFATWSSGPIRSLEDAIEWVNTWQKSKSNGHVTVKKLNEILIVLENQVDSGSPDPATLGMFLEAALSLKDREADSIVQSLLEHLLDAVARASSTGHDDDSLDKPVKTYIHRVMKRFIRQAGQTIVAQDWLTWWWNYHEKAKCSIPPPTAETYAMLISAWGKEKEPGNALALLEDMHDREDIHPQLLHYEACLNAFLVSAKKPRHEQIGYGAEALLVQLTLLLEKDSSGLSQEDIAEGSQLDSARIRVLKNLNKVIVCWIDSRYPEAAARVMSIVDPLENLFLEGSMSVTDCTTFAEAYSHVIRAWSLAATNRSARVRKVLTEVSDAYNDPTQQAIGLLFRLENLLDTTGLENLAASIPLKTWLRIYGSAISACGNDYDKSNPKGKLELALNLWQRFHDRQYGTPDTALYNHTFHVCGKVGDPEVSNLLWEEMQSRKSVRPDLKTFNWRLLAFKNSMNWPVETKSLTPVRRIWHEMYEYGFLPDTSSYNIFITCHIGTCSVSTAREAHSLFKDMLAQHHVKACQVSIVTLNAILRVWAMAVSKSDDAVVRKQALKSIVDILVDVQEYSSMTGIQLQANAQTHESVSTILDANDLAEDKRASVYALLSGNWGSSKHSSNNS